MSDTGIDALDKLAKSLPKNDEHRKAKLDFTELPGGQKVDDLSSAELGRALRHLKVPGASPNNTKAANVAAYERHLQGIADEAAETAILLYFVEHEDDDTSSKPDDEEAD